jgi:lysophospholipase L1-like esterase
VRATGRPPPHPVSLSDVAGARFVTEPEEMFALDRFHPSSAGYRRLSRALLPSILASLSADEGGQD